jgi:uncharacterized protein
MAEEIKIRIKEVLREKLLRSTTFQAPSSTRRQLFMATEFPGKVTSVIGLRRTGKTTLLHQVRQSKVLEGFTPEALPFINFEDERLGDLAAEDLSFLIEEHARLYPHLDPEHDVIWFLDEIQVVPDWERFVRRLLDSHQQHIYVSGSSAALLSKEIATSLRGRAWSLPIFPFSFEEYLRHNGIEAPQPESNIKPKQWPILEAAFLNWLQNGGMPEAQGHDRATIVHLIKDYVDVVLLRDIAERHAVSNLAALRWLVRHLLGNAGSLFSVEKFHASLKSQGFKVSRDTVHQLLAYIEDAFLVRIVNMESSSERQRMVNPRKAYPIDTAFSSLYQLSSKANVGHALETACLIELERRGYQVTYVRTPNHFEVDFLARGPEGDVQLLQICADASSGTTSERELRALEEAKVLYPEARALLLVLNRSGFPNVVPDGVEVRCAYEWALSTC